MTEQPTISDRIADTIRDQCPANPATLAGCSQCTAQHAAVMAVIGPELDAKDAEIAELRRQAELADTVTAKTKELLTRRTETLRQRAEAAEAQLRDQQNGDQT